MMLLAVAASVLATALTIHVPVDLDPEFLPEDNRTLQLFYAMKERRHRCTLPDSFVYDTCAKQGDEVMYTRLPYDTYSPYNDVLPLAGPCGSCMSVSDKAYVIFCNERGDRTSVAFYSDTNTCNQLIKDGIWGFNHSQHHVVPLGDDNAVCTESMDDAWGSHSPAVCPAKPQGICWGDRPRYHVKCGGKTEAQCTSPCKWDVTGSAELNQRRIYVEITDFKRNYRCVNNQCVISASGLSQSDCQAVCGAVV